MRSSTLSTHSGKRERDRKEGKMFQLDMKSNKSVYEQVIDRIKELVVTGVLNEGTQLPSVRELSRQLTINPNTVQKAFKELERDGYIYTVSGKGTFVAGRDGISVDKSRTEELLASMRDNFKALTYLGLEPERAKELAVEAIDREFQALRKSTISSGSESNNNNGGSHDKR